MYYYITNCTYVCMYVCMSRYSTNKFINLFIFSSNYKLNSNKKSHRTCWNFDNHFYGVCKYYKKDTKKTSLKEKESRTQQ
uniref:Uncharacterized protein n=1 Tax=Octopus bimaculoides TaxID=37653 RepID=A0A0L8HIN6_OCTBM